MTFIAMAPMLIVSAIVAVTLTSSHIRESEEALHQTGRSLASWIARSSEFFVLINDLDSLNKMLKSQRGFNDNVVAISIYDADGRLLSNARFGTPASRDILSFSSPVTVSEASDEDGLESEGFHNGDVIGRAVVDLSRDGLIASRNAFIRQGMAVFLLGVLISMTLAMVIANSLVDSIIRIADAVKAVSEGRLEVAVANRNDGELGVLERGINQMAVSLREAKSDLEAKISSATENLQKTIVELERKNIALDEAKEKALQASRAKEQFLAQISHELRTPLNGIIGYGELLEEALKAPLEKRYIRIMRQAGDQLLSLINDLLTFSELRAGKRSLSIQPIDVEQVVDEVVGLNRKAAAEKGLALVVRISASAPLIAMADRHALRQVVSNLVANAVKFTASGSVVIRIFGSERNGQLHTVIMVEDTGIGVPEEIRGRLFKPFSQGDGSIQKRFGGTGLGLSISRELMQRMGGVVELQASGDLGSRFYAALPAAADEQQLQHVPSRGSLRGVFAVVVDEIGIYRSSMIDYLLRADMTVRATATMDEALAALSDHGISGGSGASLLVVGLSTDQTRSMDPVLFREISRRHDVPIILLVGDDAVAIDWSHRLADAARVAVRTRPVSRRELYAVIDQLLARTTTASSPSGSLPVRRFDGLRATIVDDNDFSRELLAIYLSQMGCSVDSHADARDFLPRLADGVDDMDVIFLDIHMPDIDGYEVARRIRQAATRSSIVLIAVTADLSFAFSEGKGRYLFDSVVYKPVNAEMVCSVLQEVFTPTDEGVETIHANVISRERFLAEARAILDRVSEHFDPLNRERMKAELHKLNGIAANLGAPAFSRLASTLESGVMTLSEEEIAQSISWLDSLLLEQSDEHAENRPTTPMA